MRDLRRVAIAHDFTWTDKELADMIHCFDGDGDGKVSSCSLHSFYCEKGHKSMWL
jgi:Ca2+-binding EF-hand superfamily protein